MRITAPAVAHADLSGVTSDQHHAQGHTHLSHTGIGTDDHHAQSHTHLSHTGIGASDHHAASLDIRCRVRNSLNLSIANNVDSLLTYDTELWDTDAMHDLVTNTGRITIVTAGLYVVSAHLIWAANATGQRQLYIQLNVADVIAGLHIQATAAGQTQMSLATMYNLVAGDYLTTRVLQNSGAALNVTASSPWSPGFAAVKVLG